MIYKFNQTDTRSYGVLPLRENGGMALSGMFDMPKRTGMTEHNWGDQMEPYVAVADLAFGNRTIGMKMVMSDLSGLSRFQEAYQECRLLTTEWGEYRVIPANEMTVERVGETMGLLEMQFLEPEPEFPDLVLAGSGGDGFRLDDYHLEHDLGIYVAAVKGDLDLPKRIEVSTTLPYQETDYREMGSLTLECVMRASGMGTFAALMGQLHALCALPGLRDLRFPGGRSRKGYIKEGFKVNVTGEGIGNFSLKMEVL